MMTGYSTYQVSNESSYSWYEDAKEILKDEKVEVASVALEAYLQKAYRPPYSIMSLKRAENIVVKILNL